MTKYELHYISALNGGFTMNKRTIAITEQQYQEIIRIARNGIDENGVLFKPNNRLATILILQANLGLRISDILNLKLADIVRDGERYRLDITEQKTKKARTFTVIPAIYDFLIEYAAKNDLGFNTRLFDISERAVQKQLKIICDFLGFENVSTHSFRKFYATQMYQNNNYDIELVRVLLQHSNAAITQKYIGISPQRVEQALQNHNMII